MTIVAETYRYEVLRTELMALPNSGTLNLFSAWEESCRHHFRGEKAGPVRQWQR